MRDKVKYLPHHRLKESKTTTSTTELKKSVSMKGVWFWWVILTEWWFSGEE
jgi:hypothetical protein